jgi:hypothetical protein
MYTPPLFAIQLPPHINSVLIFCFVCSKDFLRFFDFRFGNFIGASDLDKPVEGIL